jgi:phenylacetate-CoA ligase
VTRAGPRNWRALAYQSACWLRGDRRIEILRGLRESERLTSSQLLESQQARLQALLLHAAHHVPFYRDTLLRSGVVDFGRSPQVDLSRFTHLPLLDRATIRAQGSQLCDGRPPSPGNPRFPRRSGGTTGDPLWVVQDHMYREHTGAVTLWFDEWSGHALGRAKVALWEVRPRPMRQAMIEALARFLKHETLFPISTLSDSTMDRYLRRLNRRPPSMLLGYSGAVHQLARLAEATGIRIAPPRVLMVSAEPLSSSMRETIERVFGAPVINRYGALETGGIACECLHRRGLHVSALTHHVEIVRSDGGPCGPGEVGHLVITVLSNYSMPLIRYRIGDLATVPDDDGSCPCGRPFPRISTVVGRALDSFVRRDGVWVHGVNVKRFYHRAPWVAQFQVIQVAIDRIVVKLIDRDRTPDPLSSRRADLQVITAYFRDLMGADCQVDFEFVESIPRAPSGKYRLTVRLVRTHADDPAPTKVTT